MNIFPKSLGDYPFYVTDNVHKGSIERYSTPLNDIERLKIYIDLALIPVSAVTSVGKIAKTLTEECIELIKDFIIECIDVTQIANKFLSEEWAKEYAKFDPSLQSLLGLNFDLESIRDDIRFTLSEAEKGLEAQECEQGGSHMDLIRLVNRAYSENEKYAAGYDVQGKSTIYWTVLGAFSHI